MTIAKDLEGVEMSEPRSDRATESHKSVGELLADLSRDAATLFRQELELARAEIRENVDKIGQGVAISAGSGAVLLAGLIVVLMGATYALGLVWPLWAAALFVGVAALIVGGVFALAGRARLKAGTLKPRRTLASLGRDKDLAKGAVTRDTETRERVIGRPATEGSYA